MGLRQRQLKISEPGLAARRATLRRASLFRMLWPVLALGGFGIASVLSMARLSELEYEARRLERLSLEQDMRRAELLRERAKLTNHAVLWQYAEQANLVAAGEPRPLRMGTLPTRQVYWPLPGEERMGADGELLGWRTPALDGPPL